MPDNPTEPAPPRLHDPWERRAPIPLDGWFERHEFGPILLAVFGLVAAFVLFQLVISPAVTLVLLAAEGVEPREMLGNLAAIIEEHARSLLIANTVGQIFGLALPAYLLARLHTSRPGSYLRVRPGDVALTALAVVGLFALTPSIQWLGSVNQQIPLPEFIRQFEQSQMELIERVLRIDTGLAFNLVVLAITPALCEELLFRGYVQRQLERGTGVVAGILISGIVFGLYHLRLSQAIPLCILGVYLAWLVWRTGSLWPAVVVHFMNNAIAIAIGAYVAGREDLDVSDIEAMEMPWYLVVIGLAVLYVCLVGIRRRVQGLLAERAAGAAPQVR